MRGNIVRGWNKKGKEKAIPLFAIVSVISLISPISIPVSAAEIDDLLSKTKSASNPKPSVMVTGYALSPETLMPSDVGVLTITLENMQDKPIERDICLDKDKVEAETHFTMDAYIKEAHIVDNDFKVYNRHISAGVIGPGKKVDFTFKIKAPFEEGIYIGKMKPGESAIAVFNISGAEEGENSAVFKAVYKKGVNKHESNSVCVRIPCYKEKEREKGESLLEEQSATSLSAITSTPTPISSSSLTPALKLPGVGVAFAFAGLLAVAYLLLLRRKRKGSGEK
ncbi:MAG: hypothetical protein KAU16_01570 [Methanophagales archaeon]|nr:hypothetical protein [Methanophagales archaeon]